MLKRSKICFFIFLFTLTNISMAQVTVEEVLSGLERREKAIKDLRIMYQFVRARTPEDVEAMKENPDLAGKGYYYFTKQIDLFAMSTDKYIYEHLVSTNGSRYQAGLDHWHIIRAVDLTENKGYFWEHTSNRLSINGPDIPHNIKLNFITTSPYVNGQLFQIYWPLSQALRKYQDAKVEKIETMDKEIYCTILFSNFMDEGNKEYPERAMRYRINITRGYTPVLSQRIYEGKVTAEYNYLELKNFGGNIWLPLKTEFSSELSGSPDGKPRTAELKVLNIKVNVNPSTDWLEFKKPKGCYVSEYNKWPSKNPEEMTEEEKKEGWKTGEKLAMNEEANYFEPLFGLSYPEVIQLFDKIEY